jgi:hypothetical protein
MLGMPVAIRTGMNEENFKPEECRSLQRFAEFFDSKQWSYTPAAERPLIRLNFTGDNARWECAAIADPKDAHLVFISLLPCRVPSNRRAQVSDLFARFNWGLTHGCFELNVETGEARCRTSQPLPSPEIHHDFIAELVFSNLWAVDHFFGTIMSVVYTRTTPRAALNALVAAAKSSAPKPLSSDKKNKARFELN